MDDDLLRRYSRHIMLEEIGEDGQERIRRARVLIVGAGGLASPIALYLAAAGIGEITVCDDDEVDLTNLQRQILYGEGDIGKAKTAAAAAAMRRVNPNVEVRAVGERLGEENAATLIGAADIVADASDNYPTRHLVNRIARKAGKPLVFGAAMAMEGQMTVFDGRRAESPCYHCLFSESDYAEETRCALMGVFAPLVGIVGAMQAAATLRIAATPDAPTLAGRLLLLDARDMRVREVRLNKDAECPVCN